MNVYDNTKWINSMIKLYNNICELNIDSREGSRNRKCNNGRLDIWMNSK